MEKKHTFWTDSNGHPSWMRMVTFLYFLFIAVPGSWLILMKTMNEFISEGFSWEQMTYSVAIFVVIQLGWIAPKHLSKIVEENGLINKMMDKSDGSKQE